MVVDLKTGIQRKRTKDDLFTQECPVKLLDLQNTDFTIVLNFIGAYFPIEEKRKFIQKLFGYALTGENIEKYFFVAWGLSDTAKSTLFQIFHEISPFIKTCSHELIFKCKSQSNHSQIPSLKEYRSVVFAETNKDEELNNIIKILSGGGKDEMSGRPPYGRENIEFSPTAKIFIYGNHKPKIDDEDDAFVRRYIIIPFETKFVDNPTKPNEKKKDENLVGEMKTKYLDLIFSWFVQGAVEWYNERLKPIPEDFIYKPAKTPFQLFLEECCTLERNEETSFSDLYDAYKIWCENLKETLMSKQALGRLFHSKFDSRCSNGDTIYAGIKLNL
jgi:putative DNA primase/helicase